MGENFGFGSVRSLLLMCLTSWIVQCSQQQGDLVPNEHLVVLGTDANDMAAVFISGRWGRYDHANYPFTSSGRVSPACLASGHSNRCRKLPVIESGRGYVVLAPLQNAVGLMELRYDGRELLKERDFTLSITSAFDIDSCIPLDIISFEDRLTILCLENMQVLRSCNIEVNRENISRTTLSQCVELYTLASPADLRYVSNFISYEGQVVFASSGVVYGIRFDRLDAQVYSSLGDVSCDRLQYAGNHIFYAYCASGQTLKYNIDSLEVENTGLLIPFVCPQSDQTLFRVQQTNRDTIVRYNGVINYRTAGLNFTIGECYDGDLFLLLDSIKGTQAFRQSSTTFKLFSNSSRDRNFEVFDGPYVVVHRTNPGEVVLYDPSFGQVASVLLEEAASVAVITDLSTQLPEPLTTMQPPVPRNDPWYARDGGIALLTTLPVLLLVTAMIFAVLGLILYLRKRNKGYRVNENGQDLRDLGEGREGSDDTTVSGGSGSSNISVASTRDSVPDGRDSNEEIQLDAGCVHPMAESHDHFNGSSHELVAQQ